MNHLHKRKSLYFLQHSGPGQNENLFLSQHFDPLGIIENTSTKEKQKTNKQKKTNSSQENRRYIVTDQHPITYFMFCRIAR